MKRNVRLRAWQLSDKESLAHNANNINVWNHVRDYFPYPYTVEDAAWFINMVNEKPKPATEFAIEVDGEAAGGIGISLQPDVHRIAAEMGYWLGEKYWNQGIMTYAVKEMLEYSFANFPLEKIFAPVFEFNIGSQKVLEKVGFAREAILKRAAIKNGKIIDLHYYSFFK